MGEVTDDESGLIASLRAQILALRAESGALNSQVERLFSEKACLQSSLEGQWRNTRAFMEERDSARAENERLRYVLDGVAGAIDTGRNEPLVIWREQIRLAKEVITKAESSHGA